MLTKNFYSNKNKPVKLFQIKTKIKKSIAFNNKVFNQTIHKNRISLINLIQKPKLIHKLLKRQIMLWKKFVKKLNKMYSEH